MSNLESVIWHVLGYSAMPMIFLAGFVAVAAIALWILSLSADKQLHDEEEQ